MTKSIDLVFLYDKSRSMSKDNVLNEQLNIETMIIQFNETLNKNNYKNNNENGNNNNVNDNEPKLKVGVISFGCSAKIEVNFTFNLHEAISLVHSSGTAREGCTRTDLALEVYMQMLHGAYTGI